MCSSMMSRDRRAFTQEHAARDGREARKCAAQFGVEDGALLGSICVCGVVVARIGVVSSALQIQPLSHWSNVNVSVLIIT